MFLIVAFVVAGFIHSCYQTKALKKDGTVVRGIITQRVVSGVPRLTVEYSYRKKIFENYFTVTNNNDTLREGDKVLILISKSQPDEYFEVLKRIK